MSDSPSEGFGKFVPGFDFLQNLTKGASQAIPQMPNMASWIAPTLDVEELDKRISELKAVHFWLDQNSKALGATVQALEVQKMTLAALKGMNVNMGDLANSFKPKAAEPVDLAAKHEREKAAGAARRAGAAHIVVTDVSAFTLRNALKVGADQAIHIAEQPEALAAFGANKGSFDLLFEASGNESALRGALDALRPRGVIVQVGIGGEMKLPMNTIVAKEFDLRGAFRFHEEFAVAVGLLNSGLVDVKPLISATLSYRDPGRAFALAADRSQAMKVLLDFD